MTGDIERELRASLADHAHEAPAGDALAERIIAEADRPGPASRRTRGARWRAWSLPVIAAGSVAAVVVAIVASAQLRHPSAHPATTPTNLVTTPAPESTGALTPAPTPSPTTQAPTQQASENPVPTSFQVTDLTFVSRVEGWALGSGQCFNDPSQRCTALLHTVDGGQHWGSVQNPPANVSIGGQCPAPCVQHVRFANRSVGYAYGPRVLLMTTDGGQKWLPAPDGATALEVANGIALRVLADGTIQRSDAGTDGWLPTPVRGQADQLGRASHNVFVRTRTPGSALYASTDDGRTWANRANPCAAPRGVATPPAISDLVVGADGSVTLLCRSSRSTFLITSTDGGATFGPPVPDSQFPPGTAALGAADASTLFFVADSLYRSGDGGRTWQRVATDSTTGSGTPNFIGFEDSTTGRWVTGDGSTVWTTTDSGKTWRAHAFR